MTESVSFTFKTSRQYGATTIVVSDYVCVDCDLKIFVQKEKRNCKSGASTAKKSDIFGWPKSRKLTWRQNVQHLLSCLKKNLTASNSKLALSVLNCFLV